MDKKDVVIEVLLQFLTPFTAVGRTEIDNNAYVNLQKLCYIHYYCYELIKENAELKGDEPTVDRSRFYAIEHLKSCIDEMTTLVNKLEVEE